MAEAAFGGWLILLYFYNTEGVSRTGASLFYFIILTALLSIWQKSFPDFDDTYTSDCNGFGGMFNDNEHLGVYNIYNLRKI